ncbi:hypothetical protein B0O80DRAFT_436504 [Mortierella sp. GBAus27b]|nr:hypothetical protein B0O80DRAFT_436504 [Mortierella sp. GBAus27b]
MRTDRACPDWSRSVCLVIVGFLHARPFLEVLTAAGRISKMRSRLTTLAIVTETTFLVVSVVRAALLKNVIFLSSREAASRVSR